MVVYCISTVLFTLVYSVIFNKVIQSISIITYNTYTHVGIIIFMFVVGIFYFFYKKEEVMPAEYELLNAEKVENKPTVKTSPIMMRIIEVMLGSANGLIIVLYLIAYSLILSI